MTRAEAQALDAARVAPWHTPRHPGPHADGAAVQRWEWEVERRLEVLDGLHEAAERREAPAVVRGSPDAWRRPLMRPVVREVRPMRAVDARQLGLFEGAGRREEAA